MTSTSTPEATTSTRSRGFSREHSKVLAGSLIGTTIEWFDFFIYAQAAGLIFAAQYFAPVQEESATLAQVISWASLGISFLFRPLGAILAGHLGDRYGRKIVLVITLLGMGGATVLIGLLPNYATIGIAAPILLVLLRILQGISAGGEWGGAALMTVEHAPTHARGHFGAYPQLGVPLGMFLATIFMLVLSAVLTPEQFEAWGWRVPFVASLVLIFVGSWIRQSVEESPVFTEMQELKKDSSAPLSLLFKNHKKPVFQAALIFAANNAAGYLIIAFFTSYATSVLGMDRPLALLIALIGAIFWGISTLVAGDLSDRVGRRKLFIIGYALLAIWAVPTWLLVDTGNFWWFLLAVVVLASLLGPSYGPMSAWYAEMFPAQVRLSGISIGYALGSIIGGAFAPMIAQLLLNQFNSSIPIGIYIAIVSVISLIAAASVSPKIEKQPLR